LTTVRHSDLVRIVARPCSLTIKQAVEVVNELFGKVVYGGLLAGPLLLQEAVAHGHFVRIIGSDRPEAKGSRDDPGNAFLARPAEAIHG